MEKAPFQVGGHVYPPYFVGRDKELEEIVRGISTLSQNYLIIGPRRSGKSSLLANVESELVKRDLLVIAVNCIEATTCSEFFRIVVERALEAYEKKSE
jgi:Archaeal ATPase.